MEVSAYVEVPNEMVVPPRVEKNDNVLNCVVCYSATPDRYVFPCRHLSTCYTCLNRLYKENRKKRSDLLCPICRSVVKGVSKPVKFSFF